MFPLNKRYIKVVVLIIAVTLVIVQVSIQIQRNHVAMVRTQSEPDYDTGGKIPGNPDQSVASMRKLFGIVKIYRSKHSGLYPQDIMVLFADATTNPLEYGFADSVQAEHAFHNPDTIYADSSSTRSHADLIVPYVLASVRPDGSPVGSQKVNDKRDVLISLNIYTHNNGRHPAVGKMTSNPVGFDLILWNDGEVQKVPYYETLYVPEGNHQFSHAFPGQAGVPSSALTYDQFYHLMGWEKGPRGSIGSPGIAYQGR